MSQVSTEHAPSLLGQWSQDHRAQAPAVARTLNAVARALPRNVLDKAVTGATIVLLAPAIFAVWIAIRRSGRHRPQGNSSSQAAFRGVIGHGTLNGSSTARPGVILKIKPAIQAISA